MTSVRPVGLGQLAHRRLEEWRILGIAIKAQLFIRRVPRLRQQRLLDVIGQTARLEQRPVLAIVPPTDPAYAATPVTCPTDEEQQTDECSFSALENEEVVYEDDAGNRYRLGPAVIAGGDIVEANAVLGGATGSEWTVSFRLSGDATQRFADATTAAVSSSSPVARRRAVSSAVARATSAASESASSTSVAAWGPG